MDEGVRERLVQRLREAKEHIHTAELRLPQRNLGEPDEVGPSIRAVLTSAEQDLREALTILRDDEQAEPR